MCWCGSAKSFLKTEKAAEERKEERSFPMGFQCEK